MNKIFTIFCLAALHVLFSCSQEKTWYRGNTHAHTVICGHADSEPEVVARWYLDHGYNFLILSEHNHFINPDSVILPENRRQDFILIPGEEVTGPETVHSTGMNTDSLVSQRKDLQVKSEILQNHVDMTRAAGGHTILNHPNYRWAIRSEDVLPVKNLYMFELYNGHPAVHNFGDHEHPGTEELWDHLLSEGMMIYGVSSDDAHHFSTIDSAHSNPGRGWVMVRAAELSADAVTHAMVNGDFYASSGVILKEYAVSDGIYTVQVDEQKTRQEIASPDLRGKKVSVGEEGITIEFIGPKSAVLTSSSTAEASYTVSDVQAYVRVKITYRITHPDRGLEEYFAWGQPLFTDERKTMVID